MRRRIVAALALALAACSKPPIGNDRVFVSDEEADVVHVLDGLSGQIEGTLRTGERPRGLALSPDRKVLYVAAGDSDRIEAWDTHLLTKIRDIASGSDPERLAVSPDGRTLYAANEDKSAVSFIDVASGLVTHEVQVGPEPEGIGISPDGKLLIATSEVASVAHFIDVATARVIANEPVGSRPREVLFLKGGKEAWVTSEQRGTIHVFDTASRKELRRIDLVAEFPDLENPQAVELELTRDGKRAFVAMGRGDRVAEIDPATYRVVRFFPTGHRTWGISLAPDDSRLYAASGLSGTVTIVDLKANEVLETVDLGGRPWTTEAVAR
jgi:PQQ-dependent catabolism-associated beta-propeller protein